MRLWPRPRDSGAHLAAQRSGRAVVSGAPSAEALPEVKNVIAVASGKGGVGKSTTALNLALTLVQRAPLSGAVIVTTANELSLIDARKGLKMFEKVPVLGIVENMAHFTLPDLPDRRYYLFGRGGARRSAERLGIDFLGEVPIDPRIVEGGDAGRPILLDAPESEAALAFGAIAEKVVRKLAVLADGAPETVDANITWVST